MNNGSTTIEYYFESLRHDILEMAKKMNGTKDFNNDNLSLIKELVIKSDLIPSELPPHLKAIYDEIGRTIKQFNDSFLKKDEDSIRTIRLLPNILKGF